jgi:hypothetical protein
MSAEAGKTEYRLQYSDRNGVVELSGPEADARRIQNVLFGHGRAGDSELGLDAQSNLFEFADSTTLLSLTEKAKALVAKYCPSVRVNELVIDLVDNATTGKKDLVVAVSLGNSTGVPHDFALVARPGVNTVVVSTLVL